jgi:hypothetical protein
LNKVPLVNLPGEVRGIDPSITLSSDVKVVAAELRIGFVEVLKSGKGIL